MLSMKPISQPDDRTAAANISRRIKELSDWRGETLAQVRQLIHEADPDIREEWKWRGTPVWSHDGIVCTGESYKQVVKLTFARGAALNDPKKLFGQLRRTRAAGGKDSRSGRQRREPPGRILRGDRGV